MQRVALVKTRTGYTVHSFDFTDNIYAVFTGVRSLMLALNFCQDNGYEVINMRHYRRWKDEEGHITEKKE